MTNTHAPMPAQMQSLQHTHTLTLTHTVSSISCQHLYKNTQLVSSPVDKTQGNTTINTHSDSQTHPYLFTPTVNSYTLRPSSAHIFSVTFRPPHSQNTHNTCGHTNAQTHTNPFHIYTAALNHPFYHTLHGDPLTPTHLLRLIFAHTDTSSPHKCPSLSYTLSHSLAHSLCFHWPCWKWVQAAPSLPAQGPLRGRQ